MTNAKQCGKCEGCKHRNHPTDGDWCYMFADRPEKLPCAQHDKFAYLRGEMCKLASRSPAIVLALALDAVVSERSKDHGKT